MQSVEATAVENGEVIAALPQSGEGVAVFPADDACAPVWRRIAGTRRVIDFSLVGDAVVSATWEPAAAGARLAMITPLGVIEAQLAVAGLHNVRNAMAASACAIAAGCDASAIAQGLAAFVPVSGRGVRLTTPEGASLIDDSYNANPDSVRAAIELLAAQPAPRVLVLGDMGEVGSQGPAFHREVGAYARTCGIDVLYALGAQTSDAVTAFGAGAAHFESVETLLAALRPRLSTSLTVLVKGSRFMRMERVVDELAARQPAGVH